METHTMTTHHPECSVQTVAPIFTLPLHIPNYQRPYKWQAFDVHQLLDDLQDHFLQRRQRYRLGTLVLHRENSKRNIVDGQQRLTTLYLLLHALNKIPAGCALGTQTYPHTISHQNIARNHQSIQNFVTKLGDKKSAFADYVLNQCELVCIELDNLEEAFQFFDSQNARGKSLAPYDLLKAYHLREMPTHAAPETIHRCVENWEAAVNASSEENLETVISKTLFRLRRWHRNLDAEVFKGGDIGIFKGVSERAVYPYLTAQRAEQAMFQAASTNPMMFAQFTEPPYQINQTLFNGQRFFDYIQRYRELYRSLFSSDIGSLKTITVPETKQNLWDFVNKDQHAHRTGDRYVRNLFYCAVLLYADKFGSEYLPEAALLCLRWAYTLRAINQRVDWRTIEKAALSPNSLLRVMEFAEQPQDVLRFLPDAVTINDNISDNMKKLFPNDAQQ
jgi:hypothetical protein